jgi:arylsulfatase A-like enzyme
MKFALPTLVLALGALALDASLNAAERPNVVFILADDSGDTDIGAFAEQITAVDVEDQFYETPNLGRLAKEGVSFSQAYACPLCAPTRSSLLTGRYAAKLGFMTATPGVVHSWYNQGKEPLPGYLQ